MKSEQKKKGTVALLYVYYKVIKAGKEWADSTTRPVQESAVCTSVILVKKL